MKEPMLEPWEQDAEGKYQDWLLRRVESRLQGQRGVWESVGR